VPYTTKNETLTGCRESYYTHSCLARRVSAEGREVPLEGGWNTTTLRRSSIRGGHGAARVAAWLVLAGTACRGTPPAVPAPAQLDIVRRHWDQACQPVGAAPKAPKITELFDTAGLGSELEGAGLRLPTRVGRAPHVDLVSRYRADGRLLASGLWESSVDSAAAEQIGAVLRSRARSPLPLLQAEGFRARLTLTPWPTLSLASAIECMPHMIHGEGEPPVGLPDTVRTWAGSARVREGDESTVTVDLLIDEEGRVLEVTKHAGGDDAFVEARAVIRQLRFDPPLRNGEAIRAWLRQSFRFRRSASN